MPLNIGALLSGGAQVANTLGIAVNVGLRILTASQEAFDTIHAALVAKGAEDDARALVKAREDLTELLAIWEREEKSTS